MTTKNLNQLYQYFDDLVSQDTSSDDLFSSSYLKGFIALSASKFGDETQNLSNPLSSDVDQQLKLAKAELSPQDSALVNNFWQQIKADFFS